MWQRDSIQAFFDDRHKRKMQQVRISAAEGPQWEASATATGPSPPGEFLFEASPLVVQSEALLEEIKLAACARGARPSMLDVGCGSGRDAVIVASKGWAVMALDRDRSAVGRCRKLATTHRCVDFEAVRCTLKVAGDLVAAVQGSCFDAVMLNRTLHRETLPELAQLLRPRGLLLFHTFLEGNTHPTDPKSVLGPSELRDTFEGCLDIIRDEALPVDDGRVLSFFVARKPG